MLIEMTKDDIIQQMTEVVEVTMTDFKSDFYHSDKCVIENSEFKFPFIWIVGKSHTHMLQLGNYKDDFFALESCRYDYICYPNPWGCFFTESYYAGDKWFLVTENSLQTINREQAKAAIKDYVAPAVQAWVAKNGPLPKLTRVPIHIYGITFDELKNFITECRNHGDDSLLESLKRFHNYRRVAANQYVEVHYRKRWNEFLFSHIINDKETTVGHIVFHGWPETGYQTNGAVQIYPQYGWHSHT